MNKLIRTLIKVKLQFEATHNWPGVVNIKGLESVRFLKDEHRHIFYVTCVKEVTHSDRDVEIIQFKKRITTYLAERYYNSDKGYHTLGSKSCEMLAEELLKMFGLVECEVLEDNENGGIVRASEINIPNFNVSDKKLLLDNNDSITRMKHVVTDLTPENNPGVIYYSTNTANTTKENK